MATEEPFESTEEDVSRVRMPNIKEGEMFGIDYQLL
jgi:translation initiation factor 1A